MNIREYRACLRKMDREFGYVSIPMFDCSAKHHGDGFFSCKVDDVFPMTQEFRDDGSVLQWLDAPVEDVVGIPTLYYSSVSEWMEKSVKPFKH